MRIDDYDLLDRPTIVKAVIAICAWLAAMGAVGACV